MAWEVVGTVNGGATVMREGVAGSAVAKGDPLVYSSGKLIPATGGDNAVAIIGVAAHAASADGVALLWYALTPDTLVKIAKKSGDTITLGTGCGIDTSTFELSDDETSTYYRVKPIEIDPADSSKYLCVSKGWLL